MDVHGYLWTSMDIYGYLWTHMDMDGHLCLFMDEHGYLFIFVGVYGHLLISMDGSGKDFRNGWMCQHRMGFVILSGIDLKWCLNTFGLAINGLE